MKLHKLQYEDREIIVLGTAHVSKQSVEDVRRAIEEEKPDTICVELDQLRYEAMTDKERWRKLNLFQVIRDKKVLYMLTTLALSAYQRKIGEKLGVLPGAEMLEAVQLAKQNNSRLVLADRDLQATLKRTWSNLSLFNRMQLVGLLFSMAFTNEEISEEQVEKLKEHDMLSDVLQEFAKAMPRLKKPLIDERDQYLIASVRSAPGPKVLAVVGAGHVAGMLERVNEPVDREALKALPVPSFWFGLLKWIIPSVILCAFYYGWQQHQSEGFLQMLYAWILPNSIAAALLSVVAGARPLTVLVSFVGSPITSLNPTIGTGMFAGLTEAWLRKPTVEDCERVPVDSMTVKGWYGNRVTRVLLVAMAASIGSSLGAWVGASWVLTLL